MLSPGLAALSRLHRKSAICRRRRALLSSRPDRAERTSTDAPTLGSHTRHARACDGANTPAPRNQPAVGRLPVRAAISIRCSTISAMSSLTIDSAVTPGCQSQNSPRNGARKRRASEYGAATRKDAHVPATTRPRPVRVDAEPVQPGLPRRRARHAAVGDTSEYRHRIQSIPRTGHAFMALLRTETVAITMTRKSRRPMNDEISRLPAPPPACAVEAAPSRHRRVPFSVTLEPANEAHPRMDAPLSRLN